MSEGLSTASAPPAGVAASNFTRTAAIAGAVIGVLAGLIRYGPTSEGIVTAVLLGALGALAVIDFRHQVIPHRIVLPAAAAVLALRLGLFPDDALEWMLAALGTFVLLLSIALIRRDSIGVGDAEVGLLLGAGLGIDVAYAILIGVLALWPVAGYMVLKGGVEARKTALPLTPALALGAAIVALA